MYRDVEDGDYTPCPPKIRETQSLQLAFVV